MVDWVFSRRDNKGTCWFHTKRRSCKGERGSDSLTPTRKTVDGVGIFARYDVQPITAASTSSKIIQGLAERAVGGAIPTILYHRP